MYSPTAGEKTSPIMAYTANSVVRGEVVSSENVRVNTWLRTAGVPEYLHITRPQLMVFGSGSTKPASFSEIFLPVGLVFAFHVLPPVPNEVDYPSDEKNRIMVPVTAMVGSFLFKGSLRISSMSSFRTTIELAHSVWTSMYDVEITNPFLPQMPPLTTAVALLRSAVVPLALVQ